MNLELKIQRMNTEAFIDARPTMITLIPVTRVRNTGGGFSDVSQAPRKPQKFRVIELTSGSTEPLVRTTDGSQRTVAFQLLGSWNSQMATGDEWVDPKTQRKWKVAEVTIDNGYERRGLVIENGR